MKKYSYLILLSLLLSGCKTHKNFNDMDLYIPFYNFPEFFTHFDFDLHKNDYPGFDYPKDSYSDYGLNNAIYFRDNRTNSYWVFSSGRNSKKKYYYFIIPPKPHYFSIYITFYSTGEIESTIYLAGFNAFVDYGNQHFYDKDGKHIKTVNHDEKFGKWPFLRVLKQLHKDKLINLRSGKNRYHNQLEFYFDEEVKDTWEVLVYDKDVDKYIEKYWVYYFDAKTGKYARNWFERIKNTVNGPYPIPKNDREFKEENLKWVFIESDID